MFIYSMRVCFKHKLSLLSLLQVEWTHLDIGDGRGPSILCCPEEHPRKKHRKATPSARTTKDGPAKKRDVQCAPEPKAKGGTSAPRPQASKGNAVASPGSKSIKAKSTPLRTASKKETSGTNGSKSFKAGKKRTSSGEEA